MSPLTVQSIIETIREQGWLENFKNRNFLIRVAVNFVVFAVIVFLFIFPTLKGRSALKAELGRVRGEIQTANRNIANLPGLKKSEQDYRKNIGNIQKTLWTESKAANLISVLSEMARESNVIITGSEPEDYPEDFPEDFQNFYDVRVIRLECEADYHAFGTFMDRLESYERLIKVIRFIVSPLEGTDKERFELSVVIFSTVEQEE